MTPIRIKSSKLANLQESTSKQDSHFGNYLNSKIDNNESKVISLDAHMPRSRTEVDLYQRMNPIEKLTAKSAITNTQKSNYSPSNDEPGSESEMRVKSPYVASVLEKLDSNQLSDRTKDAYKNLIQETQDLFDTNVDDIMKMKSEDLGKIVRESQQKRLERLYKASEESAGKNSLSIEDSEYREYKRAKNMKTDPVPNGRDLFRKIVEENLYDELTKSDHDKKSTSKQVINVKADVTHDFKETSTTMFDEVEKGEVVRSIGSYLYQDFKNRVQRQNLVLENLNKEVDRKMNESKVNKKSRELVIKKIQKDIANVLDFVDDQNTNFITYNGLGYILFFLDVFKIHYNEQYLQKVTGVPNIKPGQDVSFNHKQLISFVAIKNEQKRKMEEQLHKKIWEMFNPCESEYIEREILNEFLKL